MYTIDKYTNDTFLLTNSLVIKLLDAAYLINKGLIEQYDLTIPEDRREWKYYMNLAGMKHQTNNDISIYLKETGVLTVITKQVLLDNPGTRNELLLQGDYFDNYISIAGVDRAYAMGMLFPVDLDSAIAASDGTIMAYNDTLVEPNERSLIRELTDHIKGFLSRWHITDYIVTDELYYSGMLGVLYSTLPTKIMNIRLSKIGTNEVALFHLEHYFRSKLDIWESVKSLNNESIIWLYNNMDHLLKNVGKETTLDTIIDKIFTANSLGIGVYLLDSEDTVLEADAFNPLSPQYLKPGYKLTTKKLNSNYVTDNNKSRDVADIVKLELSKDASIDVDIADGEINSYADIIASNVADSSVYSQLTKLLDINSINTYNMSPIDETKTMFEQWLYLAFSNYYTKEFEFNDPSTNKAYRLTPKTGIFVMLKLLMELVGSEQPVSYYNMFSRLRFKPDVDPALLKANLLATDDDNQYIVDILHGALPAGLNKINVGDRFSEYLTKVLNWYTTNNILMSNVNNIGMSANIKHINNVVMARDTVDLVDGGLPITPTSYLAAAGVDFTTGVNYDYASSIKDLLSLFTGLRVDKFKELETYMDGFIDILNKLTSYTTQVVKNVEDLEYMHVQYTGIGINNMSKGAIKLLEVSVTDPLEPFPPEIVISANNFHTYMEAFDTFPNITRERAYVPAGYANSGEQQQELVGDISIPTFSVQVVDPI